MEYEQLIPWVNPGEGAFRVISGDYVTTEDGTGIVHIAPTFGADDAQVAKAAGVPPLQLINKKGELRPMVDLTGKFYKLDELDENFVKESVRPESDRSGRKSRCKSLHDDESQQPGVQDREACAQLPALLAYGQTGIVLSVR